MSNIAIAVQVLLWSVMLGTFKLIANSWAHKKFDRYDVLVFGALIVMNVYVFVWLL